jgi:3-oxoacyl-[acyl-carrier protein] reductase
MKLKDRVALITGAGSGIGRGSAVLFAREGAKVAVVDMNQAGAEETVALIKGQGGSALAIKADVTVAADVEGMIAKTVKEFGKLDILFNNAGVPMSFTPIEDVKEELWDRIMDVNAKGIYLGAKYTVPYMKKQGGGVIINTASISGVRCRPGLSAYSASKGAAITLTKSLAIELASFKIRVNCINPVAAETPMLAKFIHDKGQEYDKFEEGRQRFISTVPLGRLAEPDDIAYAALYLASDEASLVTGIALDVDGGRGI